MPVMNEVKKKNKLKCKLWQYQNILCMIFFTFEDSGVFTDIPKFWRETCACMYCATDIKHQGYFEKGLAGTPGWLNWLDDCLRLRS